MHPVIAKTFGGLSRKYYFRQFFFGLIFSVLIFLMLSQSSHRVPISAIVSITLFIVINTFLYPYSRYVYESLVGFILGKNVFFVNALLMLFVKLITMYLCWAFAVLIAPIGLAYLYYHHSKDS